MDETISIITDAIIKLKADFKALPDFQKEIDDINAILENTITKAEMEKLVTLFATGYFATKNSEYDTMITVLMDNIKAINEESIEAINETIVSELNNAINTFKSDLNSFKGTIKNGKDGINGRDGRDGLKGKDGTNGNDGKDGINGSNGSNGTDGVGIKSITMPVPDLLVFELTDGTKKQVKLNIVNRIIGGGGGGVSEARVIELINEALAGGGGGTIDAYTKVETQTILPKVGFDVVNPLPVGMGQLAWNIDEGTLDLGMVGATLQLGQEILIKVRNAHTATITNGTVVMVTGSLGNSGRLLVKPHTGLRTNAKAILGIMTQDIDKNLEGYVTAFGKVRGINTTGSLVGETWVDGDVLYLKPNDSGKMTKVVPQNSEVNMPVAVVINSNPNGVLFVRVNGVDENAYYDYQNLFIQTTQPTLVTGKQALWIDTNNGNITFNLVTGD